MSNGEGEIGYIPLCAHRGPGPAVYQLKPLIGRKEHCYTKQQAPAYTIGKPFKRQYSDTPGPVYTYDSAVTSHGKQTTPSFSFPGRARHKVPEILPGPGAYEPTVKADKPKITLAPRFVHPNYKVAPPPNAYNYKSGIGAKTVTEKSNPSVGFRSHWNLGSIYYDRIKSAVPGPGSYSTPDVRLTRNSAGSVSIKSRTAIKEYNTAKEAPAPGSYETSTVQLNKKGFYMGQKHSQYEMPLIGLDNNSLF